MLCKSAQSSFFTEDLERLLAQDAVACQPAGGDGESGGGEEAEEAEIPLDVVGEGEGAEEVLDDDVGEEDADGAGDQAEDGELDREDAGDAGAGGSEGFEDDDLAYAAVAGAGDG